MSVRVIDGVEYEVVWDGGSLLPDRLTKPGDLWEPPRRIYNKKSEYWKKDDPDTSARVQKSILPDKPSEPPPSGGVKEIK